MENIPGFNLRAQVVGQGGAYLKHIQNETRCRVQIKGRGSGFMEHSTGVESEETMYLHVASPDAEQVDRAKKLCEDLLDSVRKNYEHFKENPPPQRMESYTDGYGADANRGGYGGGGYGRDRRHDSYSNNNSNNNYSGYNQNHNHYEAATPTTPAPGTAETPTAAQSYQDQWAAYYAQNPEADPYAAYGGYQAYMQYYYSSYYQQQGQAQPGEGAPPPPADGSGAPPPPANHGGYGGYDPNQNNGYNAVPPPPGM